MFFLFSIIFLLSLTPLFLLAYLSLPVVFLPLNLCPRKSTKWEMRCWRCTCQSKNKNPDQESEEQSSFSKKKNNQKTNAFEWHKPKPNPQNGHRNIYPYSQPNLKTHPRSILQQISSNPRPKTQNVSTHGQHTHRACLTATYTNSHTQSNTDLQTSHNQTQL